MTKKLPNNIKKFFEILGYKDIGFFADYRDYMLVHNDNGEISGSFFVSTRYCSEWMLLWFNPRYMMGAKNETDFTERFLKSLIGNYGTNARLHYNEDVSLNPVQFPKGTMELEIFLSLHEK